MTRQLWGALTEDDRLSDLEKIVSVEAKRIKLEESEAFFKNNLSKRVVVKIKNPFVTQTIEVMKQTEMLKSLIDTYSTKSGPSNYLLNPCQIVPEVDFPVENATDFAQDEKYNKPIWFIPSLNTRFARGLPHHYSKINSEISKSSLRKVVCSQLRVTGFTDVADSSLNLFADAVEEFVKNLMQNIREVHINNTELEKQRNMTVRSLEKAYFMMTNISLIEVHNYWRSLLARNRFEINEYKSVFQEYDKLMKESQSIQKEQFQDGDILNILEMPQPDETTISESHMQECSGNENALLNIFESHTTIQNAS